MLGSVSIVSFSEETLCAYSSSVPFSHISLISIKSAGRLDVCPAKSTVKISTKEISVIDIKRVEVFFVANRSVSKYMMPNMIPDTSPPIWAALSIVGSCIPLYRLMARYKIYRGTSEDNLPRFPTTNITSSAPIKPYMAPDAPQDTLSCAIDRLYAKETIPANIPDKKYKIKNLIFPVTFSSE